MWVLVLAAWLIVSAIVYHRGFNDVERTCEDREWVCGLALMWPLWVICVFAAGALWVVTRLIKFVKG